MNKVALITGITGQDGSFLAEFLIEKGYEVHGLLRRSSSFNTARIEHLYLDEWVRDMKQKRLVNLHWADMTDSSSLIRIIRETQPTEIYNLAAQSHVKVSFDVPEYTADTDAVGVLRLLEAVRICGLEKTCRIYQASTSELFGLVQAVPQKETTPFYPRSPYGVAKLYGFWIMKNYRESYGMYCCNGILFNHESERRGETFVTRKITLAAARIAQGFQVLQNQFKLRIQAPGLDMVHHGGIVGLDFQAQRHLAQAFLAGVMIPLQGLDAQQLPGLTGVKGIVFLIHRPYSIA